MFARSDSPTCDRAREWASLRLDGEISELEEALLEAHLRRCAACSEYDEMVGGAVLALRAQPLEELRHGVVVDGRRRIPLRVAALAPVAAVVAAVVGVVSVLGTQTAHRPAARTPVPVVATDDNSLDQLRALRVMQLSGNPTRTSGVGQFGAVLSRQVRPDS
jgi:predicted anti-sigma-YlaC factor YlaD